MFDLKFDWDKSMETGVEDIDTQHKQLFRIGRDIEQLLRIQCIGVTDKQLLDIVCALRDYTGYHFYVEERMMEEMCYPHFTAHKKFHKKCSDFVMKLDLPKIKEEPYKQMEIIHDEVQQWIMSHVLGEDCNMTKAYQKYQKEVQDRTNRVEVVPEERYGRFLKEYDVVKLYLYKDQTFKGHVVAVFKESAREMARLSALERNLLFADLAKVGAALKKGCKADSVCYLDLEDMDEQLVYHMIPKYKADGSFGRYPVIDYEVSVQDQGVYEEWYNKLMKYL